MIPRRAILVLAWLWFIGLVCLALPFLWWPREFGWRMLLHAAVFLFALSFVVRNGGAGGMFDHKRSPARGYAGVLAYSAVIFAGVYVYRWLVF